MPSYSTELLAPAGNLEKLKLAFYYGADAVYCGGHVFGLRKYSENFTLTELKQGISIANQLKKKVYVVLNGFAHNEDLPDLITYLKACELLQPHAFIISDLGVFELAKTYTTIPLHVSTQASVTNHYSCQFWKNIGAKRIILAREVSISDCKLIQQHCPIELECFIHGAMCASYSGKCTISNISSGRDSNRGGCVQSCRHNYHLFDPISNERLESSHIMNAKDLMGIHQIPAMIQAGIMSFKIEGRMKSNLYVANAVRCYRQAIDYCLSQYHQSQPIDHTILEDLVNQLELVSNRSFSTGGLVNRPDKHSIHYSFGGYQKSLDYVGLVRDLSPNKLFIDVKNSFKTTDSLLFFKHDGTSTTHKVDQIWSINGDCISETKQNSLVALPMTSNIQKYSVVARVH